MADKATREGYGDALRELGAVYDMVVLDADLSKSTKTDTFKKQYPDRFINCGIAEGNMMSIAAGIAATGKLVFASSFAMFAAGRAFEQVRNSIGYTRLPVNIGATHAGLSVGEDGATHQCNEDIATMRAIPNMTVVIPADYNSTKALVKAAAQFDGPVYLRLGRLAAPNLYPEDAGFEIGKGIELLPGSDISIISAGLMLHEAVKARQLLAADGISARVIDMHTVKPIDKELIVKASRETGAIVTAEEHSVIGGLGSAVSDVVSEYAPCPVLKVGVQDSFGKSGEARQVLRLFGLTAENIAEKAKAAIRLKG